MKQILAEHGKRYGLGDWCTHISCLSCVLSKLQPNSILELGAGDYSSIIFHDYIAGTEKRCLSLENNPQWCNDLSWMHTRQHEIRNVTSWDYAIYGNFDLVFIDHSPESERIVAYDYFFDKAKVVILHDANYPDRYGYIWDKCKFVLLDKRYRYNTSISSNSIDITDWL